MILEAGASEGTTGNPEEAAERVAERLRYSSASGRLLSIPAWAAWFIEVGALLCSGDPSIRRWVIATVPDRRFAALFSAVGAVVGASASKSADPSGNRLDGLAPGDAITWIDADGGLASGVLDEIRDGAACYRKRVSSHVWERRQRPLTHCGSFWPMQPGEEPFAGSTPMSVNPDFVSAALPAGMDARAFLSTPGTDAVICGVRTTLDAELNEPVFSCGGHSGCLRELVRPSGLLPTGQRARTEIIPSALKPRLHDPVKRGQAVAIFDGAPAFLRWREGIDAACNLVIIDRWAPHAHEAAIAVLQDEGHMGSDVQSMAIPAPPPGIECISWAGER